MQEHHLHNEPQTCVVCYAVNTDSERTFTHSTTILYPGEGGLKAAHWKWVPLAPDWSEELQAFTGAPTPPPFPTGIAARDSSGWIHVRVPHSDYPAKRALPEGTTLSYCPQHEEQAEEIIGDVIIRYVASVATLKLEARLKP